MNTEIFNDSDDVCQAWYETLNQMCAPFTSEQIALWLVEAGLTRHGTSLKSVAAHVRAAMNAEKPDYFKQSELIILMKHSGSLAPVNFVLEHLGCIPATRCSEDAASLMRLSQHRKTLQNELIMIERKLGQVGVVDAPADKPMALFYQR